MLQKVSELSQLTVENFRRFGFDVAYRSREHFLVLMLTNCYLAHHDHLYQVGLKWTFFQEMMLDRAWDLDEECYGLSSPGYRLNEYWSSDKLPRNDYSFLPLRKLTDFFSPARITETDEVDDYGASDEFGGWPGTAYFTSTSEEPVKFRYAQFVHCDLSGLNFHRESTFTDCNFNHANLRGSMFYVQQMDLATLVTLKNARLDPWAETNVLDEIERHRSRVGLRR